MLDDKWIIKQRNFPCKVPLRSLSHSPDIIKAALFSSPSTCIQARPKTMESCSWPDHLPSDRRRAIAELVKGRDFALQLRDLVHSNNNNVSVSLQQRINQDLALNILNSFTNTLSILKRSNGESDEVSQVPTPTHFTWDADVPLKSEDSEGSSKTTSTIKDRRGCYKRR